MADEHTGSRHTGDEHDTIDALLDEQRTFAPSAAFKQAALVADTDGISSEQASALIDALKGW